MRALVWHSPREWNDLVVVSVAPPALTPGGVRIAHCASVSFATGPQVAGRLRPHVSHRFALDQFRDAMHAITSRAAQGRVIIRLQENP